MTELPWLIESKWLIGLAASAVLAQKTKADAARTGNMDFMTLTPVVGCGSTSALQRKFRV
jgi:hypothetical protein